MAGGGCVDRPLERPDAGRMGTRMQCLWSCGL